MLPGIVQLPLAQRLFHGAKLGKSILQFIITHHKVSRDVARKDPDVYRSGERGASRPARTTPAPRSPHAHRATPPPPAPPTAPACGKRGPGGNARRSRRL